MAANNGLDRILPGGFAVPKCPQKLPIGPIYVANRDLSRYPRGRVEIAVALEKRKLADRVEIELFIKIDRPCIGCHNLEQKLLDTLRNENGQDHVEHRVAQA